MKKPATRVLTAVLAIFLYLLSVPSFAQNNQPAAASAAGQGLLSGPQLEALVSPIALYPDALLSEMLMASTYPLEVVAADRWAKSNTNLQGDQLTAAVQQQPWDQSVKSLVATPDVLDMMSSKLDWTQKLGDAVLAQQPELMDAVQRLRQKAESRGKLTNTAQQTVRKQVEGGKQVIAIEPTEPDTVYVPYYDPAVAYGEWPYPDYPPYYFGYPGYIGAGIVATGLAFGGAYALGRWALNGNRWGGGLNWGNNQINPLRVNNINVGSNNNWVHNPAHRGGQRYNNANVAQKFGGNRNNVANRGNFRGSNGKQVLNPGGNRPGSGNAAGNRPGKGNVSAGKRPAHHASKGSSHKGGTNNAKRASTNRTASNRTNTGNRASANRSTANRSAANRGARHTASRGSAGRGTFASAGGGRSMGGARAGGGGGMRAGGGGGRGGGGRRSDLRLKHDVVELGQLGNGIGLYRFVYNGGHTAYVGVIAQEVQNVTPAAVTRGSDGYLRVHYEKLGLKFQTYRHWLQIGGNDSLAAPFTR